MTAHEPTQVVVLTPPGRGAVATIRVAGPAAEASVAAHFHPASGRPLASQPVDKIWFGRWGAEQGEGLVVARRGESAWEIHCHGGTAAVAAIVASLTALGCEEISWRDWLLQTESDPIRAEAHIALAAARTERTARILLDQYHGALRRALDELHAAEQRGARAEAAALRATLLDNRRLGLHLVDPWRVVLAGPPNVGKSSLINALVGYQRAIVFDQPGTTRDVVTATTAFDGWPVELADTAGLRASDEAIESAGIARTRAGLASADLVLLVFDSSAPWTPADADLAAAWPQAILVHNKSDLPPASAANRPSGIATSTRTGAGLTTLMAEIARRLVSNPPPPGAPVPFTARQIEEIEQVW